MATIVLVRHATTAATGKRLGGWTKGVRLDTRGRAQAERLARRLSTEPIKGVYASPLERTQDTARILARPHGLRVATRKAIGEVDYGEWTDKPLGQLRQRKDWRVIQATPSRFTFPGGESIRGAQARAVDQIETIASEHGNDHVIAVTHADIIKAVLAHFLGMPLDTFQRLTIAPASMSLLHLTDGQMPAVTSINETPRDVAVKAGVGRGGGRGGSGPR